MHSINHRKRRVLLAAAVGILIPVALYVGSYISLRNRGIREMKRYDGVGILYDSTDKVLETQDLSTHHFRAWAFAPLNSLDQTFLNGPGPVVCILFDLS